MTVNFPNLSEACLISAKVLAKYNDGKPTIIERTVGKGKVIFSAVLPLGTSEAALVPGGWNVPLNAQVPNK